MTVKEKVTGFCTCASARICILETVVGFRQLGFVTDEGAGAGYSAAVPAETVAHHGRAQDTCRVQGGTRKRPTCACANMLPAVSGGPDRLLEGIPVTRVTRWKALAAQHWP